MKYHSRRPPKRRKKFGHKQQLNLKFFRIRNKEKRKIKERFLSLKRGQNK